MGPGWANKPVWVHIKTPEGKLRTECLQPEQQPPQMALMHHMKAWLDALFLGMVERITIRARSKP